MIRAIFFLTFFIFSSASHASSGFTWLGVVAHKIHFPEHVMTLILVSIIIIVAGLIYRVKIASVENTVIPDRGITLRNIWEAYGNFIYGQCRTIIGEKEAPHYFSFIATTFIVILISNLIGLIPGFLPPTEQLSTTVALGIFSFIYYNVVGCKVQGVFNYIKHFCGPLWYLAILFFPIEIISNVIRPISLALRLRSNMMGDHMVLSIFNDLSPVIVPIIFMMLGILVSVIQAYVFTVLSMVYIALVHSGHDHGEEHAH